MELYAAWSHFLLSPSLRLHWGILGFFFPDARGSPDPSQLLHAWFPTLVVGNGAVPDRVHILVLLLNSGSDCPYMEPEAFPLPLSDVFLRHSPLCFLDWISGLWLPSSC